MPVDRIKANCETPTPALQQTAKPTGCAMNPDIQQTLQPFVRSDERLIWCGRPDAAAAGAANWAQSLVGLSFLAVTAILALAPGDPSEPTPYFLIALTVPFVAMGVWMTTRTFRDFVLAGHTFYGVTGQRILILRLWPSAAMKSYTPEDIGDISTKENPDGSGDILFRKEYFGAVRNANTLPERVGFWGVPDAHDVSMKIHALKITAPAISSKSFEDF
jgi:hypothetical protein